MNDVKKNGQANQTVSLNPDELNIQHLFKLMVESDASDLHLSAGSPPRIRIDGEIVKVKIPKLDGSHIQKIIFPLLNEEQVKKFVENRELDFSFGVRGFGRYRANFFYSKNNISAVFRQIPSEIPKFESLNLPGILYDMTCVNNGLILVTGPTGSGKSTTLASLLDKINGIENGHIVTLEDPIEFIHSHKNSIVNQREVGADTNSFKTAIKSLLRQDPDIVLVGELRDAETIEAALLIAETGHLVFGTLHTNSCVDTINRVINIFPPSQQNQIRTLLSFVLQGVVSQQLIKRSFSSGRCLGLEVMVPDAAIRNLIREGKLHQVYSQMQIGQEKTGMITMNQSLKSNVDKGYIDMATAMSYSPVPEELQTMLASAGGSRRKAM